MKSVKFPLIILGAASALVIGAVGILRATQPPTQQSTETSAESRTHIILLLGQSNMSAAAADIDPAIDTGDPRILQFAEGKMVPATEPLTHLLGTTGGGPGLAFARKYLKTLPSRDRIFLVPSAVSGVGFSTPDLGGGNLSWDVSREDTPDNIYLRSLTHIRSAIDAVSGPKQLDGALLNVGGTDAYNKTPASEYQANLDELIVSLRRELDAPNLAVVLAPSRPDRIAEDTAYRAIYDVQKDTPRRLDHTAFIEGADGEQYYITGDGLHYNMAGHRLMGVRYAHALDRLNR